MVKKITLTYWFHLQTSFYKFPLQKKHKIVRKFWDSRILCYGQKYKKAKNSLIVLKIQADICFSVEYIGYWSPSTLDKRMLLLFSVLETHV